MTQSGQKFAHDTTAKLSWHVQNCDLMWSLFFAQEQSKFSQYLDDRIINRFRNGSLASQYKQYCNVAISGYGLFTKDFAITIQSSWKICLAFIQIQKWSQQNFAQETIAALSRHTQKFMKEEDHEENGHQRHMTVRL